MIFGVDDSEVVRIERRLRDDRLALAQAGQRLLEQSRRTLTRPSTLALLLVAGGLAGARAKASPPPPDRRRGGSALAIMLSAVAAPLLKGLATLAVQRAFGGEPRESASSARSNASRDAGGV